ncbi:MAG: 3-deoxy-D-manno-octulosonic acid transferase [Pseudorhodoplanes sp.]
MAKGTPLTLRAYRLLTAALTPLSSLPLWFRGKRGKEHPERVGERRGEPSAERPAGSLIWIHGASVGELFAAFPLIDRICSDGLPVLVTSGTVTSAALARERLPANAIHQFVPLDMPRFVARFIDHWRPNLALFIESDLWPNLVAETAKARIPMIVINGRLSERSFNRWRTLSRTAAALLRPFDLCLAQSALDADRFSRLGASNVQATGNLKLDVPAPPVNEDHLNLLKAAIRSRPVIAAASTHPGEEAVAIEAHRRLRRSVPDLLTIIAPRHPQRGRAVFEIADRAGLSCAARSQGQLPQPQTQIYIFDTMGELGLLYRLASIVFMGGSLVEHGGQNPIEAVKLGAPIVHGPNVWNFAEIYAALDAAHGAEEVEDMHRLTTQLGFWLSDGTVRRSVADAGLRTVNRLGGALAHTLAALEPYLLQFRLEHRSNDA